MPQKKHNKYVRDNNITGGKIPQITEFHNWYGLLDAPRGVVYESSWSPRYSKQNSPSFPFDAAMKHDRKYKTYYSFYADNDFSPNVWRALYQLHKKSNFVKKLADYAWQRYIFENEQTNSVLLWPCHTGNDVTVN